MGVATPQDQRTPVTHCGKSGRGGGAAVRHMSYDLIEIAMVKIIQLLKMMLNVKFSSYHQCIIQCVPPNFRHQNVKSCRQPEHLFQEIFKVKKILID